MTDFDLLCQQQHKKKSLLIKKYRQILCQVIKEINRTSDQTYAALGAKELIVKTLSDLMSKIV